MRGIKCEVAVLYRLVGGRSVKHLHASNVSKIEPQSEFHVILDLVLTCFCDRTYWYSYRYISF